MTEPKSSRDVENEEPSSSGSTSRSSSSVMKYEKTPGTSGILGQQFEYKMAALVFLRGVNQTSGLYMGTNVAGAGAFDDVVFKYKHDPEFRTLFVQFKHNEPGNLIIKLEQLLKPSGDFSMYKYYKSWCEVAMKVESEEGKTQGLFGNNFSKCEFLIFTNGKIDRSLTSESPQRNYSNTATYSCATNKDYPQCYASYLNETTVNKIKGACEELMRKYKDLKDDSTVVKKNATEKDMEENNEKNRKAKELKACIRKYPVEEFLQSLQWFTEQASEKDLVSLIEEEIKTAMGTSEKDTEMIAKTFVEKIKLWWEKNEKEKDIKNEKEKDIKNENAKGKQQEKVKVTSDILTETSQLWEDIVISRLNLMNEEKRKEKEALNINFTDQEINSFNQSLSSNVINVTSPHFKLTGVKISQLLEKNHDNKYIFMTQASLLSRKSEVLCLWQSVWCDVLVVECSTVTQSLVDEITRVSPGKKLILLSESALPGYQPLQDEFNWNQLEATSQKMILEKKVDFQGREVSLESVVGEKCSHSLVTQVLSPDTKLSFGKKILDNISYYIPRSLQRSDYVKKEILSSIGDYVIISNVKEQDVTSLEDSYGIKLKKLDENQDNVSHRFYWTDNTFNADTFTRFCQKIPDKNVHWLSVDQDNDVYWKQSFNNMDCIKEHIDKSKKRIITAEDLKDIVNERVVLVAAEPGMGKSTFLNNVVQVAKNDDNSLYAIRLDLNNVTRHLKEHAELYFTDQQNITNFLIEEARNCDLDDEILRSRLTQTGTVNVYLDGYDEISPYYNDKVTNMIKSMMKLKVGQIWLTSRNVMRDRLESELASICYSMKPFTDEDQVSFLVKLWNVKYSIQIDDTSKEFAQNLLKKASESFSDRDREFTGIPLQCMMLGEVFAEDVTRGDLNLPNRLDLLQLFETFVFEKINILNEVKLQIDTSKPSQIENIGREKMEMMGRHSNAAILVLLSDKEIDMLKVNKNEISTKAEKILSVGKEYTGLIDGMTDGDPSFIHRCFAEYFLAWWLSENILSSTDFIAQKLFEPRFVIVRQFFDRLLARDCPLHNAVLSADREQVEALLTSGADVNQLDKSRRSALHLVVDYCDTDRDMHSSHSKLGFHETAEASTMQLLLTYNADVNLTDKILQGTPVRYADISKLWGKVEHLLKNKANTDGLVELRKLINTVKKEEDAIDQGYSTRAKDVPKRRIRDARSTLFSLVARGCFHILQFAVDECGLEVNTRLIDRNDNTSYLLHAAAKSGREDSVKFLLKRGADMMLRGGNWEMLPIHEAAEAGSTNIMPLLIESGINVKDKFMQRTLLHYAAESGHLDTVKWLVDAGAEVDAKNKDNETPLHWAVRNKHVEVAKYLIEKGADVKSKNSYDVTPLHYAAKSGEINTVMLLLNEGAEVDAKTLGNKTPLHLFCEWKKQVEVAKYLIEVGADVNVKDSYDVTPLHYAAKSGEINTVMLLLNEGAEVDAKTLGNKTPLHLFCEWKKHVEVAKYLIEAGADVNAKDSYDVTPLHLAAMRGHLDTVKWLVYAGAEVDAKDWRNETPLHRAVGNKHVEVAKYLVEAGADQHCADSEGNTPASLAQDLGPEFIEWLSTNNK